MNQQPEQPDQLLVTVDEAARLLSIGRTQVYKLIGSGELPSIKLFRSRRIQASALRDYVAQLGQDDRTHVTD